MKIGILGVGAIGATLTQRLSAAGHEVQVANSRGPETIAAEVFSAGGRAVAERLPATLAQHRDGCLGNSVCGQGRWVWMPPGQVDDTISVAVLQIGVGRLRPRRRFLCQQVGTRRAFATHAVHLVDPRGCSIVTSVPHQRPP